MCKCKGLIKDVEGGAVVMSWGEGGGPLGPVAEEEGGPGAATGLEGGSLGPAVAGVEGGPQETGAAGLEGGPKPASNTSIRQGEWQAEGPLHGIWALYHNITRNPIEGHHMQAKEEDWQKH